MAGSSADIWSRIFASQGYTRIRSVDVKPFDEWYQQFDDVENVQADLKLRDACTKACRGVSEVYNLAADMGGMGFIENNKALCMLSVLINTHLLQAAHEARSSASSTPRSACVYNADKQRNEDVVPLKEEDAYPAMPEDGYGWEKLFSRADVPALPRRLSASRRAWPASTTSTARTAPGTAAAKKPRPPFAAR